MFTSRKRGRLLCYPWGVCHQNWIRTNIPGLRTWYAAVAPSDNFVVSRLYEIICCSPTNLEKCSEAEAPLLCMSSTKFYLTFETSLQFYFSITGWWKFLYSSLQLSISFLVFYSIQIKKPGHFYLAGLYYRWKTFYVCVCKYHGLVSWYMLPTPASKQLLLFCTVLNLIMCEWCNRVCIIFKFLCWIIFKSLA